MSLRKLLFDVSVAGSFYLGAVHCIDAYFDAKESNPAGLEVSVDDVERFKDALDKRLACTMKKVELAGKSAENIYAEIGKIYEIMTSDCNDAREVKL